MVGDEVGMFRGGSGVLPGGRESAGTIRIVPARTATRSERQQYFDHS
jgi:uncharacterized DUF497 family protein